MALVLVVVAGAANAHADPAPTTATKAASEPLRPHTLYVELGGKGGLWGLGYDLQIGRFAVGAAASFYVIDRERIGTFSPYVAAYLFGKQRHRFFTHAGPQIVRVDTSSPVPEWPGSTTTAVGGELGAGYEYRHGVVIRAYAMASVGKGGIAPWLGLSLGWSL